MQTSIVLKTVGRPPNFVLRDANLAWTQWVDSQSLRESGVKQRCQSFHQQNPLGQHTPEFEHSAPIACFSGNPICEEGEWRTIHGSILEVSLLPMGCSVHQDSCLRLVLNEVNSWYQRSSTHTRCSSLISSMWPTEVARSNQTRYDLPLRLLERE